MGRFYKKYMAVFLLPCLVCFLVAFVIPFVYGIVLSFFSWRSSIVNITFVGLDNYAYAITDNKFQYAFLYTALFTIVSVITVNVFAFAIALLLTRGKRFTNGFRTVFFMPNLIGGIILGKIWQVIINAFIKNFINPYLSIFDKGVYGFWGLVILMNWQLIGYMAIIYIAAIAVNLGQFRKLVALHDLVIHGMTHVSDKEHNTIYLDGFDICSISFHECAGGECLFQLGVGFMELAHK